MPSSDRLIVFLHVQKTGGTTINNLLRRRLPDEQFAARNVNGHIDLETANADGVRIVAGHITAHDLGDLGLESPRVFTVLRDPIERALSHYYFLRSYTTEFMAEHRHPLAIRMNRLNLDEWLADEEICAWLRDFYLKRFDPHHARGDTGDRPELGRALDFLESCELLGVTPRLGEFAEAMFERLGLEPPNEIPCDNRRKDLESQPGFQPVADPPPTAEQVERLRELVADDHELYAAACRRAEGVRA